VRAQNAELKRQRELPEDLSVLPTLRVSDIPLRAPEETQVRRASARTELVEDAANGVGYVRLKFEPAAAAAGAPLLLLLPVLANLAGAVDAAGADYKRVALLQELYGGSLQVVPRVAPDFATGRTPTVMYVEHDLLAKNAAPALELLGDVLAAPSFGSNEARRLQGLLATHAAACTASLTQDAMAYSRLAARASLGPQFAREELFGGTPRVAVASKLASGGLAGAQQLAPVLDRLSRQVFSGPAQASVVARPGSDKVCVCEGGGGRRRQALTCVRFQRAQDALLLRVEALLDRLERAGREGTHREAVELPQALDAALRECVVAPSPATYIQLSVPVHYTTAVVATPARYGHADDAALTLLGKLAQHDFLHREVREKGGAYGAGASLDAQGLFSMTSYWDPNSRQTLETYSTCVDWLCQGSFDASKVDEALLSVFGDVDAPQSPSGKGLSAFLHGVTNEMRQERFLDLAGKRGVQRLAEAAQKHLASAAAPGAFLFNGGPVPGLSVAVVGAPGPQGDGLTAEAWTVRRM
jgi:Zn-dependent M16 (insulinase) family peptidase